MNDLRALAGSTICTGFDGTSVGAEFEAFLREVQPAGVVLFARNTPSVESTRGLTDRIRELLRDPIVAIDQEGGRVVRLREGVVPIPSMMTYGAAGDDGLAYRSGVQTARDLRRAGVNVNFAPVLDLALEPQNTVIGTRSFGSDPRTVTALAGAFSRGLHDDGVAAVFKHFPGHGSTAVDSHLDLPAIEVDLDTYVQRDLLPFVSLLPGARAVMTGHVMLRAVDERHPATLSRGVLTGLLRERCRFTGVCFTDCLEMDAVARDFRERAPVLALAAGADALLFSHDFQRARSAIDAIVTAVDRGELARERLEDAAARMRAFRAQLDAPVGMDAPPLHPAVGFQAAARAITLLRGSPGIDRAKAVVVSFEGTTNEGVQGVHADHAALGKRGAVPYLHAALQPDADAARALLDALRASSRRPIVLMRRAHVYEAQAQAIRALLEYAPDAILVSVREPYDAACFPEARNLLCTYGDDAPNLAALELVLFEDAPAPGSLPVNL